MSRGEEEVDVVFPLNRTGPSNTVQPTAPSQPVTSATRTANTQPSEPTGAPPIPARVPNVTPRTGPAPARAPAPARIPAAANRAPAPAARPNRAPAPAAQPNRAPGVVRGGPRPNTRPGHNSFVYKIRRVSALRRYCVPITTVVLILASLAVIGILIKVVLDNYYYFCSKSFKFIPLDKWCDGTQDCNENEDELRCVQRADFSNDSNVRLTEFGSIVQVNALGRWNYICFDGFDAARAKAVCAQLGYSSDPTFSFVSSGAINGPFGRVNVISGGIEVIPVNGVCPSGNIVSLKCITCGVNRSKQRIVGGQDSHIEDHPWQVSLQYMGQHVCGGSILNPHVILCAAHCFVKGQQQVDRWRVQLGQSALSYLFAWPVEKIFIHTLYSLDEKPRDIAILRLKTDLSFSATIQPICLPGFDINLPNGAPLEVTGWGHMQEGATSLAPTLQEVHINVIANDVCNREYYGQVLDSMLCAGQLSGGLDTCQGDSGGPMVYLGGTSRFEQVGIVSWGDGCGRLNKPGVYTRISTYLQWIYTIMKLQL